MAMLRNTMKTVIKISTCCAALVLAQPLWAVCNNALVPSKPDAIYTNNANGTVTDEKTGLVWKMCSEGLSGNQCENGTATLFNWKTAMDAVVTVNLSGFAGSNDWRLPSVAELRSLLEDACQTPSINSTFFPNTVIGNYWSSSPYVYTPGGTEQNTDAIKAWYISFDTGFESYNAKDTSYAIRLVRGN